MQTEITKPSVGQHGPLTNSKVGSGGAEQYSNRKEIAAFASPVKSFFCLQFVDFIACRFSNSVYFIQKLFE
jgi:hypothetical protein